MKQTRLALVLAATSLTAIPAYAASVTMLQFGSFETREEAEKRLSEITTKHAVQLGSLQASVREIKLPPDNLTVYRTMAGPVENRAAAQSICARLASLGDDCYIMQTAMVAAPAPAAAVASASPKDSVLDTPMTTTDSAVPDLTQKLTTLTEVPARDASSLAALSSVQESSAPAVTSEPVAMPVAAALPSPDMQSALDKAAAEQAQYATKVDDTIANVEEKRPARGFWSRMNPFSDDPVAVTPHVAAKPMPEPLAAPIESVQAEPVAAAVNGLTPEEMKQPVPLPPVVMAESPAPVLAALPPAAPEPERAPMAVPLAQPTIIDEAPAMILPPPPAPLKAQDREMLLAGPAARPHPAPLSTGVIEAPAAAGVPPLALPPVSSDAGMVQVEEARRVPVSEATMVPTGPALMPPPMIVAKPLPPQAPAVPLLPSSTNGQKTLWAQIGPFVDGDSALRYWAGYRQAHPDFPVVRVRVTSPYQQQTRGNHQAWLRVGPMSGVGFVRNLCSTIDPEAKLRCGRVTDLGVASSGDRIPGMLPGSRYQR